MRKEAKHEILLHDDLLRTEPTRVVLHDGHLHHQRLLLVRILVAHLVDRPEEALAEQFDQIEVLHPSQPAHRLATGATNQSMALFIG